MAKSIRKIKNDFEFTVVFQRGNLNIEIDKWKIIGKKKTGRDIPVQGYGIDGMLYDGIANIYNGKPKNVDVNIKSGRWE